MQGGAHIRWLEAAAGILGAGARPRMQQSTCLFREATRGVLCVWEGLAVHTHKAVHTQGGAHTRWLCIHHRSLVIQAGCRGWPPL